jgi:tetratricopeptide (TPR) repeat protein
MKTEKKPREAKRRPSEDPAPAATESRKRIDLTAPAAAPERPPSVLGDSRNTVAALALLEKGIKLIHQKDFKKSRHEFKSLLDSFPGEAEILARARTYLQICDREEAAHKKPSVTSDQLYTLGVVDHNRGNFEGAIAFFRQSLSTHPDADYVFYSLAASLAMKGEASEAIVNLKRAIELNEDNRVYAKNDSDFSALHVNRDFTDLVGIAPAASNNSGQY